MVAGFISERWPASRRNTRPASIGICNHLRPGLAWYALPGWYHAHREQLVRLNGGLIYAGYFELFRRFLLRRHDAPVHPREPQPAEGTARLVPVRTPAG
jgi:hypothetical protein